MAENRGARRQDLNLAKLGIRQIHERIEVSPILTDPGTTGLNADDPSPKQYICSINFKEQPVNPFDLR